MRAGRLKLTSRPPPAAAPALRKVRRDRVCTAVEINSPNGFPQQDHTRYGGCWTDATSYRRNRRPLYLKLGIGLVTHRADDGTDVITSSAIGPQFGVGYEWPVSPHVLVSPLINVALGIVGGSLKFNGGTIQNNRPTVSLAQLGLGVTWHQVPLRRLGR